MDEIPSDLSRFSLPTCSWKVEKRTRQFTKVPFAADETKCEVRCAEITRSTAVHSLNGVGGRVQKKKKMLLCRGSAIDGREQRFSCGHEKIGKGKVLFFVGCLYHPPPPVRIAITETHPCDVYSHRNDQHDGIKRQIRSYGDEKTRLVSVGWNKIDKRTWLWWQTAQQQDKKEGVFLFLQIYVRFQRQYQFCFLCTRTNKLFT